MIEITGNLWNIKADAKCITTNGYIKSNGQAVMGRGIALQAATKYPELPRILGKHIRENGNVPGLLIYTGHCSLVSFPVKHNWMDKADLFLIGCSAHSLSCMADKFKWNTILLPKPGCGNGKLNWADVKDYIKDLLDDRFQIIDF